MTHGMSRFQLTASMPAEPAKYMLRLNPVNCLELIYLCRTTRNGCGTHFETLHQ